SVVLLRGAFGALLRPDGRRCHRRWVGKRGYLWRSARRVGRRLQSRDRSDAEAGLRILCRFQLWRIRSSLPGSPWHDYGSADWRSVYRTGRQSVASNGNVVRSGEVADSTVARRGVARGGTVEGQRAVSARRFETMRLLSRVSLGMLVCAVLFLDQRVDAQTYRGVIRGRLEDPSGAGVPGATVTATEEATGEVRTVVTGANGAYLLVELPPGLWRLEIAVPGHKTYVQRLVLEVDQARQVDVRLELGAITDRVEVTAAPAEIHRASSALG